MSFSIALASLEPPVLPRILRRLPERKALPLLVFSALLEKGPKLTGPTLHADLGALLETGIEDEKELHGWLRERFPRLQAQHGKGFSAAQRQANLWMAEGRWVASWPGNLPPAAAPLGCPRVLFGKGVLESERHRAALFNSRKPRVVSPQAEWLQTLRLLLALMASQGVGWASSLGTLSYDLVTVAAERTGAGLVLFLPQPLEAIPKATEASPIISASLRGPIMSCLTGAAACPKATRMVCRDRLLAFISDLHCVLELRPGGNLWQLLAKQQHEQPRLQVLFGLEGSDTGKIAHRILGPGSSLMYQRHSASVSGSARGASRTPPALRHPPAVLRTDTIPWGDYLYHYTRSCPGPWPGESYRDYLESLLDAKALAEHTALAALGRILAEGRIRAGCKNVRGNQLVISWTARPPHELAAIRHWNTALIRWTFEPYGLAVKRSALKRLGARPAIYGASAVYEKLPQRDRFRFQRHGPPHCVWKQEREWRLRDDLRLSELAPDEAFLFTPTLADAEELTECSAVVLPLVVLEKG